MPYSKQWTNFETQSLAYSLLRKHLYPQYLVRGDYKFDTCRAEIAIFKALFDKEPKLRCLVEIGKAPKDTYEHPVLKVPVVTAVGADDAYKIVNKVQDYL